jgi:hypothetical protein
LKLPIHTHSLLKPFFCSKPKFEQGNFFEKITRKEEEKGQGKKNTGRGVRRKRRKNNNNKKKKVRRKRRKNNKKKKEEE